MPCCRNIVDVTTIVSQGVLAMATTISSATTTTTTVDAIYFLFFFSLRTSSTGSNDSEWSRPSTSVRSSTHIQAASSSTSLATMSGNVGVVKSTFNSSGLTTDPANMSSDGQDISNVTVVDHAAARLCEEEWQEQTHYVLCQLANVCCAVAFLVPHNFRLSMLVLRSMLSAAFLMYLLWAGIHLCAPDILAWNFTLLVIAVVHVAYLSYRHFPPRIRSELTDLYAKVFKPLKMDKQYFSELVRDAEVLFLEEGERYAIEDITAADERLSILLSGKLKVTCEETHLHYILPNQFIDSPEWEACATDSDELFQVTITAIEPSQYLCWQRHRLRNILRNKAFLDSVIYNLIGKDITQKLYSMNEHLNPFGRSRHGGGGGTSGGGNIPALRHFPRSLSVDVVHTGTKGHVRSHLWRMQSFRRNDSVNSDSPEAEKVESPEEEKLHFAQRSVNHAMLITTSWISDSYRRMTPSSVPASTSERVPLWTRISNRRRRSKSPPVAHHNAAIDNSPSF